MLFLGSRHKASPRKGRKPRFLRLFLFCLLFCNSAFGLAYAVSLSPGPPSLEYQVKATFLFHFAEFVTWPTETLENPDALNLCILGHDPFGSALDAFQGETIKKWHLEIKRLDTIQQLADCHLLFVSTSEQPHLLQILDELKDKPVLTVSDMAEFTQQGGIVRFLIHEGRVWFEINLEAAQRAGLKISSKLLRLAKIYRP